MITDNIKHLVPDNIELKFTPNVNKRSQVERRIIIMSLRVVKSYNTNNAYNRAMPHMATKIK